MYCKECGNRMRDGAKFCDECGALAITEEEKNSEVTENNEVSDNVTQLDEEPQELRNDTKEGKINTAKKKNAASGYWLMAISLIWLALSGFMPMIKQYSYSHYYYYGYWSVSLDKSNVDVYSYLRIGDLCFDNQYIMGISDQLINIIKLLCYVFYIIGIILVLVYLIKLFLKYITKNNICKLSLLSTILFAIQMIVICVMQFLINNRYNEDMGMEFLSITPVGWITIGITILNIIVTTNIMIMNYRKKHNKQSESNGIFNVLYNKLMKFLL